MMGPAVGQPSCGSAMVDSYGPSKQPARKWGKMVPLDRAGAIKRPMLMGGLGVADAIARRYPAGRSPRPLSTPLYAIQPDRSSVHCPPMHDRSMITLHTAPSRWGLASVSPACMELETWLRMAKLPYQTRLATAEALAGAPYGKIPFIDYAGKRWGDTTLIIEMLGQAEGVDIDAELSAADRAIALAFRRMIKEHLYWGGIAIRYNVEENWQHYQKLVIGLLPPDTPPGETLAFADAFRQTIRNQMYQQGLGRLTDEALYQTISADLQALSDFLGNQPFFMGDRPTTLDATVYGHIGNFIQPPYDHPIVELARQKTNLCDHYERMSHCFFGELARDHAGEAV